MFETKVELRSIEGARVIEGRLPYDEFSRPIRGKFVEKIRRGAFRQALEPGADVRAIYNHNRDRLLGRTVSDTLTLIDSPSGLRVQITPPESSQDVVESVERGDLSGMSFTFRVLEGGEEWSRGTGPDGLDVRTLTNVELIEVGPVVWPAYPASAATVAQRSYDEWLANAPEARRLEDLTDEELREEFDGIPMEMRSKLQRQAEAGSSLDLDELRARACFPSHLGEWAIEPRWFRQAVAAVSVGVATPEFRGDHAETEARSVALGDDLYATHNGVAIIRMDGPMKKAKSSLGGCSTVECRRAIRAAVADEDVDSILLWITSPGGHVAGTKELADDVRLAKGSKRVHAHIEDMGASAAYWIASQAERVSANATAFIGSIGTYSILYDQSAQFEKEGVKVHVISTGSHKGAGAPGTEVTPAVLKDAQEMVDGLNEFFLAAVERGRGFARDQLLELADGRVHLAERARSLGLIDTVQTLEDALRELSAGARTPTARNPPETE